MILGLASFMISRSNSAIWLRVSLIAAVTVQSGRKCASETGFGLTSNAATGWPSKTKNSVSRRAIRVLPTRGRGEQTMKTGVRRLSCACRSPEAASRATACSTPLMAPP